MPPLGLVGPEAAARPRHPGMYTFMTFSVSRHISHKLPPDSRTTSGGGGGGGGDLSQDEADVASVDIYKTSSHSIAE